MLSLVLVFSAVACTPKPSTDTREAPSKSVASAATSRSPKKASSSPLTDPFAKAELGKPAPAFTLTDESGKSVSLASYKGKIVVLEWFNPDCPFVKAAHTKGSLVRAAATAEGKGVVWLAINSSAPGKQGHGAERNAASKKKWALGHPILLDPSGVVGKAYGAKRTPHIFIINDKGALVYEGAVDNSPDGEGESPSDGKLVSYVDKALADLAAKRAVATPRTDAYGCTVKYAK